MDKPLVNESTIRAEVRFIGLTLTPGVLGSLFFVCSDKKKKDSYTRYVVNVV